MRKLCAFVLVHRIFKSLSEETIDGEERSWLYAGRSEFAGHFCSSVLVPLFARSILQRKFSDVWVGKYFLKYIFSQLLSLSIVSLVLREGGCGVYLPPPLLLPIDPPQVSWTDARCAIDRTSLSILPGGVNWVSALSCSSVSTCSSSSTNKTETHTRVASKFRRKIYWN